MNRLTKYFMTLVFAAMTSLFIVNFTDIVSPVTTLQSGGFLILSPISTLSQKSHPDAENVRSLTYPIKRTIPEVPEPKHLEPNKSEATKSDPVTVLNFSYGQFRNKTNYGPLYGFDFDCIVTQDGHPKKDIWSNYSAVVVFGITGLFRMERIVKGQPNPGRDPRQIWVARGMESSISRRDFFSIRSFYDWFNFTAGVSPNATFRDSYFSIRNRIGQPKLNMQHIEEKYNSLQKDKDFCWFVSRCRTYNKRFDLGSEIINKLPVKTHMWGDAVVNCMPNLNKSQVMDHGITQRRTKQFYKDMSNCKFIFAFENSNCSDYITEKFSNGLASYAVPIVNGWRESYEEALPGSFIHVADFNSTAQLAEYLSRLLVNKEKYFEYHKWRLTRDVLKEERTEMYHLLHCRICEKVYKLREANKHSLTQIETIADVRKTFLGIQKCAPR